jgi:hypothetical protein
VYTLLYLCNTTFSGPQNAHQTSSNIPRKAQQSPRTRRNGCTKLLLQRSCPELQWRSTSFFSWRIGKRRAGWKILSTFGKSTWAKRSKSDNYVSNARIVYTLHSLYCRSMLCDSFKTVMESILRRFASDVEILGDDKKNWFIDMRKHDDLKSVATVTRQHKKKLSTYMMFQKELTKLQNSTLCPWNAVKQVPDTALFVLVETVPAKPAKEARQGKPAKVHACNCQYYRYAHDMFAGCKRRMSHCSRS